MKRRSLFYLLICRTFVASVAFGLVPATSTTSVATYQTKTALFNKKGSDYNDDAFGFIFLGGSAAAEDPVFGTVFFTLSVIALISTKLGALPANKQVPAVVAGSTMLTVPVIATILPETIFGMNVLPDDNARFIELVFCTVSMLYGFVFSASESEQNERLK